jgi:hypothetical protein
MRVTVLFSFFHKCGKSIWLLVRSPAEYQSGVVIKKMVHVLKCLLVTVVDYKFFCCMIVHNDYRHVTCTPHREAGQNILGF